MLELVLILAEYEYFPALTADGNTFLFTRNIREGEGVTAPRQEDFYVSKKVNNVWQTANPITSVNTLLEMKVRHH
jgi:hypothetical protein